MYISAFITLFGITNGYVKVLSTIPSFFVIKYDVFHVFFCSTICIAIYIQVCMFCWRANRVFYGDIPSFGYFICLSFHFLRPSFEIRALIVLDPMTRESHFLSLEAVRMCLGIHELA